DPAIADAYLASIDRGSPARQHHDTDLATCVHLLDEIRPRRATPIDALGNIGAAIGAVDDLGAVVALIADQARHSIDATSVSVARYRPDRQLVEVIVNVGELEPGQDRFPTDEYHPFSVPAASPPTTKSLQPPGSHLGSMLVSPVFANGVFWGVMLARAAPDRGDFDRAQLDVLDVVSAELGLAVEKVERLASVVDMALRDPLTGIANRRVLDERLTLVFERPVSERADCALIMCDLDGLKQINDTLGHAVGDRVLTKVANTLRAAVAGYANTEVCRIGGDEFCVIVERGALLAAAPIGDRINELIARLDDPPVSVSCGIAAVSSTTLTPSDLLRAADEAQYAVKRTRQRGRDGDLASGGRRHRRNG
ncbi:MAG: sensor domain-containing diguanylate cyclase, partial [Acidimicrobiia bacterium]|nr:sensor domain-containing diguanylate cyclase [Acidimicrobiia bacterium]